MLGTKSIHLDKCIEGNFIGADYGIDFNLTHQLPDNWREFNQKIIPIFLSNHFIFLFFRVVTPNLI